MEGGRDGKRFFFLLFSVKETGTELVKVARNGNRKGKEKRPRLKHVKSLTSLAVSRFKI